MLRIHPGIFPTDKSSGISIDFKDVFLKYLSPIDNDIQLNGRVKEDLGLSVEFLTMFVCIFDFQMLSNHLMQPHSYPDLRCR